MLQFGASLTDDTRSINYDRNTFVIQATGRCSTPDIATETVQMFDNGFIGHWNANRQHKVSNVTKGKI